MKNKEVYEHEYTKRREELEEINNEFRLVYEKRETTYNRLRDLAKNMLADGYRTNPDGTIRDATVEEIAFYKLCPR